MKLSRTVSYTAPACWSRPALVIPVVLALAACATPGSQPVVERLDPDTATTLTALNKPVELVAENLHNAGGDPFAFFGPFETDRSGNRTQYLWVSAPGVENMKVEPQLLCDGQPLTLSAVDSDLTHIGLAHPPYEKPAPWSVQWYFQLPPDTLKCLTEARKVTLQTHAQNGESDQFTVESKGLTALKSFGTH